jgi:Protein of unknown function (DUF3102)
MASTENPVAKTDGEFLREIADRIRSRMVRVSRDTVGIGRDLITARARVGYGKFSAWIESEFKMSRVTAYKLIKVAETFGDCKPDLQPSVFYALIAPDTTDEVRTEIVGRAETGERINVADVEAAKQRAKQRAFVVEHGIAALVEAVDASKVLVADAVAFVKAYAQITQDELIIKTGRDVAKAVKLGNEAATRAKAAGKPKDAEPEPDLFPVNEVTANAAKPPEKPRSGVGEAANRAESPPKKPQINVSGAADRADPAKLSVLIEASNQRTERARREWIEGTLELAALHKKAHELFPDDRQFAIWLAERKLDNTGRDDRDALLGMAEAMETARDVLEELSERWSWANIWRTRPNGWMPPGIDVRRKLYLDLARKLDDDQQKHELQLVEVELTTALSKEESVS